MAEEKVLTENELDGVSGGNRLDVSNKANMKADAAKLKKLVTGEDPEIIYTRRLAHLTESELDCVSGGIKIKASNKAKAEDDKCRRLAKGDETESRLRKVLTESELDCVIGGRAVTTNSKVGYYINYPSTTAQIDSMLKPLAGISDEGRSSSYRWED